MINGLKFEYTDNGIFFDVKVQITPEYVNRDKVYSIEEKIAFHFDSLNKLKADDRNCYSLEKIHNIKQAEFEEIKIEDIVLNFYNAKVGTYNGEGFLGEGKDYMFITQTHNKNEGWENTKVFYTAFEMKEKANEFLHLMMKRFKGLTMKNFKDYFNNLNDTYEVL